MKKLNIVADENILLLEKFFSPIANITKVDGRHVTPQQVKHADALVLRSTCKVNEALLTQSNVLFVGTCTIGTDHLAIDYMEQQGIAWSNAPGCNADGVVDYVISAMNHAWQVHGIALPQQTVGIVGVGNVGGQLLDRLQQAGIKVVCYDPLKHNATSTYDTSNAAENSISNQADTQFKRAAVPFVSLEVLIETASIICLHTPLTQSGDYPTLGLIDQIIIDNLLPNTVLISAGRGEVVDQSALLGRLQQHNDLLVYMDVWQQEPNINIAIMPYCQIVTPHIAGHSLEGKMRGTAMVYQALCTYFDIPITQKLSDLLTPATIERLHVRDSIVLQDLLNVACHGVYLIEQDDQRVRHSLQQAGDKIALQFDHLRKTYPIRREFSTLTIEGLKDPYKRQFMAALGFRLDDYHD